MSTRGSAPGRRAAAVIATATVLVAGLSACSSDADAPTGSAEAGEQPTAAALVLDGEGRMCASLRYGPDYTHWEHVLTPRSDLVLDSIALVAAENISVVGRGLVTPQPATIGVSGFSNGWPIDRRSADNERLAWDERQPASGAELEEGGSYNLFVHLRVGDPGAPAAYDAMEIHYTVDGEQHVARDRIRLRVRRACS